MAGASALSNAGSSSGSMKMLVRLERAPGSNTWAIIAYVMNPYSLATPQGPLAASTGLWVRTNLSRDRLEAKRLRLPLLALRQPTRPQ